jgi:hypothetical protein
MKKKILFLTGFYTVLFMKYENAIVFFLVRPLGPFRRDRPRPVAAFRTAASRAAAARNPLSCGAQYLRDSDLKTKICFSRAGKNNQQRDLERRRTKRLKSS